MTQVLEALPPITAAEQARLRAAPRDVQSHQALMRETPAMNAVQVGGAASAPALPADFTVAAWNVERCLFPQASAQHLRQLRPDIVLLSEVDHGMARSGQRHTAQEMAAELGMAYAFGVEFFEMGLGGPTELAFCKDDFNALGWHGNAVLSSVPLTRAAMIRLDDHGHWFTAQSGAADPEQPRLGGRMAIAAQVPSAAGPICVVSTHLESNADAPYRHAQFERLLDAVAAFAPDMPIMIGGDLNTGNHMPPDFDWQRETLFDLARERGFSWEFTAPGPTTRPSLITPHPQRVMKLDWIAARGFAPQEAGVLSALGADGTPLADHDCVWCRAGVLAR
ncbi:MAG: endonuclease/exonuclease/phosphatase family protein [Sulfitobacter sp.]